MVAVCQRSTFFGLQVDYDIEEACESKKEIEIKKMRHESNIHTRKS
jgi:hypothetical protein